MARGQSGLLLVLPSAVVLSLVGLAWVSGLARSGFWADDFTNVTLYNHSVGDLANTAQNDGKYTINFFWWLGTVAFGSQSALPFLLVVSLTSILGVWLWLWAGIPQNWGHIQAWWVAAALAATSTPLGIMLWSSNVVHAVSFLCLGVAFASHRLALSAGTAPRALGWSAVGAGAWLLLIVSNPLYLGALILAVVFVWRERRTWIGRMRHARITFGGAFLAHVGIPSLYFLLIAYPRTTSRSSYSTFGLGEIRGNIAFYIARLAPAWWERWTYVGLVVGTIVLAAIRGRRDILPLALVIGALGVALPVFMQGQQRADHYLAIPALLLFSALAAGHGPRSARPSAVRYASAIRYAEVTLAFLALFFLFDGSSAVRSWWSSTPLGSSIMTMRQTIADQTQAGDSMCLDVQMSHSDALGFIAAIGGSAALELPPVSASSVQFKADGQCPAGARMVDIRNHGGIYQAYILKPAE